MDASAYNMSFDKEQLSVLCANYDRRIDALAKENAKLKAENDRLREVVSDGEENARLILHESRVLQAENAKLRELLKAAYKCTNAGPSCLECRIVAGGCTLLSAMRDLGVEVEL